MDVGDVIKTGLDNDEQVEVVSLLIRDDLSAKCKEMVCSEIR